MSLLGFPQEGWHTTFWKATGAPCAASRHHAPSTGRYGCSGRRNEAGTYASARQPPHTARDHARTRVPARKIDRQLRHTRLLVACTCVPVDPTGRPFRRRSLLWNVTSILWGQTSFPAGQTSLPSGQTSLPSGQTSFPSGQTSFPAGQTSFPAGQTSLPSGQTPFPSGQTSFLINLTREPESYNVV